jgi:hypothetical protein
MSSLLLLVALLVSLGLGNEWLLILVGHGLPLVTQDLANLT